MYFEDNEGKKTLKTTEHRFFEEKLWTLHILFSHFRKNLFFELRSRNHFSNTDYNLPPTTY